MSVIRKHTYCTMHFFFCNDFLPECGKGGGEVNRIKRGWTVHQIMQCKQRGLDEEYFGDDHPLQDFGPERAYSEFYSLFHFLYEVIRSVHISRFVVE